MKRVSKKIRAAVFARASGRCEALCGRLLGESGHLDHFFGRAKAPETEQTTWALCLACDHSKTNNFPTAVFWLRRFWAHCWKLGFKEQIERIATRIAVLKQKGLAA